MLCTKIPPNDIQYELELKKTKEGKNSDMKEMDRNSRDPIPFHISTSKRPTILPFFFNMKSKHIIIFPYKLF